MAKRSSKKPAKKSARKTARKPAKKPTRKAAKKATRKASKKVAHRNSAAKKPTPAQAAKLDGLRKRIDRVDARLIALLNERASLVVEVGNVKRSDGTPIYAPHREAEVLDRVLGLSAGPLPARTVEAIYKELMSGSFALEQPLRIGYLGPPGSYSHLASTRQFGKSVEYEDLHSIAGVFTEVVRGHVNYGLVPVENSTGGGIAETMAAFQEHAGRVWVYNEVQLGVHHALLANCKPAAIRRIHSKPEVFAQCRTWLATQYPQAELVGAPSSSRACQTAIEENKTAEAIGAEPGSAAIGSSLAGQIYGLKVLFARIEDKADNITRFAVISRQQAKRTGDDKTSVMFNTNDKPGALVEVLGVFDRAGINLTHIDKRPSGQANWQYTFFVDAQGHREDRAMSEAIALSAGHCKDLHILGSYPRSRRIL
ncbi:MAG: chorismate mutase [Planctomycetota bacterium]